MIAPAPVKESWRIWVNLIPWITRYKQALCFLLLWLHCQLLQGADNVTTTQQSTVLALWHKGQIHSNQEHGCYKFLFQFMHGVSLCNAFEKRKRKCVSYSSLEKFAEPLSSPLMIEFCIREGKNTLYVHICFYWQIFRFVSWQETPTWSLD